MDGIGEVYDGKFLEAQLNGASKDELTILANQAIVAYQKSLDLSPQDAYTNFGITHQHFANILARIGKLDLATPHYNDAIRYFELVHNYYDAAITQENIARVLMQQSDQLDNALLYAGAGYKNYQKYGTSTQAEQDKIILLIQEIKTLIGK